MKEFGYNDFSNIFFIVYEKRMAKTAKSYDHFSLQNFHFPQMEEQIKMEEINLLLQLNQKKIELAPLHTLEDNDLFQLDDCEDDSDDEDFQLYARRKRPPTRSKNAVLWNGLQEDPFISKKQPRSSHGICAKHKRWKKKCPEDCPERK